MIASRCRIGSPSVSFIFHAERTNRIVAAFRCTRSFHLLARLLGFGKVYRDLNLAVFGIDRKMFVFRNFSSLDVVIILAQTIEFIGCPHRCFFIMHPETLVHFRRQRCDQFHYLRFHDFDFLRNIRNQMLFNRVADHPIQ